MKLTRILFWTCMAVMLLMGLYTGLMVYYIVLWAQALLVAAVLVIDGITVRRLRFRQTLDSDSLRKGEETTLRLELDNDTPIPSPLMRLKVDVVDAAADEVREFSIAPFQRRRFEIPIRAPYRGVYETGVSTLRITDAFGLLTVPFDLRRRAFTPPARLVVFPLAEAPAPGAQVRDVKLFGERNLRQAQAGDSLAGVRKYADGDSARHIHWKASLRLGELQTRQYELPARDELLLLLDVGLHSLTGEAALIYADTICECAASLALAALARGRSARLTCVGSDGSLLPGPSPFDFHRIHEWLATLKFYPDSPFDAAVDAMLSRAIAARALVILTRAPSPALARALASASARLDAVTLVNVDQAPYTDGRFGVINVKPGQRACQALGGVDYE